MNEMTFKIEPCPYCGKRQKVTQWERDNEQHFIFPNHYCVICYDVSYVNEDLTLRKLTEEERQLFKKTLNNGSVCNNRKKKGSS
jgi:hypothetical protein